MSNRHAMIEGVLTKAGVTEFFVFQRRFLTYVVVPEAHAEQCNALRWTLNAAIPPHSAFQVVATHRDLAALESVHRLTGCDKLWALLSAVTDPWGGA